VTIGEFMFNERFGRCPLSRSRNPFTCGITGKTYSSAEVSQRTDFIARALAKVTGWQPNEGTCWEKVIGVYSFNTVSETTRQVSASHEREGGEGRVTGPHWLTNYHSGCT
jgi:hypothetical protein